MGARQGEAATLYTISNGGISASVTDLGATLVRLMLPDKSGELADCVLGYDAADALDDDDPTDPKGPYFGASVGRVANRTAVGKFTVDGKDYSLAINNGPNSLHGGIEGFSWKFWTTTVIDTPGAPPALRFEYTAADMEEGFPGECIATVVYSVSDAGELKVEMEATVSKKCPVNFANHSYFNLAGHASGDILGHTLHLNCDRYTPTDDTQIPTGEIRPVAGTPFDFTAQGAGAHTIGERIGDVEEADGFPDCQGYDHNFVINTGGIGGNPAALTLAAAAADPESGRTMELYTNVPGVQFYTGNFIDGQVGKGGSAYGKNAGFALETQHFPNSVNTPNFPSCLLEPGQVYSHTMLYRFGGGPAAKL